MSDTPTNLPPRFLRTPEAARFLGLSGRTLEKHRYFGTGPAYRLEDGPAALGQFALTNLRKREVMYLESLAEDASMR